MPGSSNGPFTYFPGYYVRKGFMHFYINMWFFMALNSFAVEQIKIANPRCPREWFS